MAEHVGGGHPTRVVVVVLELVLDDELDDEDEELVAAVVEVVAALVVVVAPTHAVARLKLAAVGQLGPHAWPAGQQVRFVPEPHGVVRAGHPQKARERSMQVTPLLQQACPHGVVPAGQQQPLAGSEQVWPLAQHPVPHACAPAGHVTALPRNGRRRVAPAVAASVTPRSFNAPRLEVGAAMARLR